MILICTKKKKNLDPCAELDEDEAMIKDIISAANKLKNEFFNPTRVTELMELLLFPLLAFDTAELQEWQEEPEEFFIGQQSLSEVSNVKTVAEGLFCGLLDIAPEVVGPIIAQLLQDKNRQLNSTVALALTGAEFDFKQQQVQKTRELFFWDGVYLCAGIGVSVISSYLDDSQAWLVNVFAPVLSHVMVPTSGRISGVANEMVKTRLIWLLQVWMYQFDQTILSHALDLLVSILSSSTCDLVCKLHAVQALDGLVNLEQFEHANVVGYALPAVEALCSIVRQLNESENKIMALSLVSELFRLLSIQIQIEPLIEPLAEFLSSLWLSCPPSDPVRRTILEVLRELVGAAGPLSPTLHPIILPIITYSCGAPTSTSSTAVSQHGMDYSSKEKESLDRGYPGFLLREGLSLWLAVMRQLPATFCSPQVDLLFSAGLQPLLRRPGPDCGALDPAAAVNDCVLFYEENSADLVRDVLLIVEAYALFTGRFLISDVSARRTLMVFFSLLIGNTDPGTTPFIARSLSALLMACPNEAGLFLLETGLLHKILKILFSSVRCPHFCTLFAPYKESDISIVSYVTVIARLMLQNPVCLLNAVTVSKNEVLSYLLETTGSATCNLTEVVIMTELVYLLIDKFPHLKYHRGGLFYRRLFCCALLSLFPCPGPNEIRNNPPSGFGLSGSGGKPCKVQETAKKLLGLVSSKSMLSPPRAVPNPALDFQWLNVFSLQQLCGLLGPITSVIRTVVQEEETGEGKTGPGSGQPVLLPGADRAARTRIVRQLKELISCSAEVCDFDSDEEEDEGVMGEVGFRSSSSGEEEGRMGGRQGFDMQEILAGESLDPLSLFFCEGMCRDEVLLTSLQQKFSAKLLKLKFLVGDEVFSSLETTLN